MAYEGTVQYSTDVQRDIGNSLNSKVEELEQVINTFNTKTVDLTATGLQGRAGAALLRVADDHTQSVRKFLDVSREKATGLITLADDSDEAEAERTKVIDQLLST